MLKNLDFIFIDKQLATPLKSAYKKMSTNVDETDSAVQAEVSQFTEVVHIVFDCSENLWLSYRAGEWM